MCGIAGYQGTFDPSLLGRMTSVIAHRGPDGDGAVVLGQGRDTTGLGHRRLAIIDLSPQGRQPMTVACPRCGASRLEELALTYNGELYNYQALRSELETRGHRFHSQTDSEVLLHLYAEYGPAMVERLDGIFAFAIRDGRREGRPAGVEPGDLFIARDQLGVKPLYYAQTAAGFLFGSELKAILQAREVDRTLDLEALHYHLAYLWCPAPATMLKAVRKLEPGFAMVVRGGRIERHWSYYDLPYDGHRDPRREAQLAEELREKVASAVRRQLVADVPVGAFLSGGIDSTSVVAMMRQAGHDPVCFGVGFGSSYQGQENPDDLPYARIAARKLGVKLIELVVEPGMMKSLDRMIYHLDEPQADLAPINALLVSERARQEGIPVLLSGAGGDDFQTGYRRHWAIRFERWWTWLNRPVRRSVAGRARALASGASGGFMHGSVRRRAVKMFSFADLDPDERLVSYFWWSHEEARRALYSPAVRDSLAATSTAAPLLASLARIPDESDRLNRMLYLEGKHFLADHNLNYVDRMGMACGVEIRVPLVDLDLVSFSTRIPSVIKHGRTGKALFRRAMRRDLPAEIMDRPKSGFGVPLRSWMRNDLRQTVADTLAPDTIKRRGLFDPDAVQRLAALDREGIVDGSYTLLALMCIETWCRIFVDSPEVERPANA